MNNDRVPRFPGLEREFIISRNPCKREPTREEAMANFIRASRDLCDAIRKLIDRWEDKHD